MQRVDYAAGRKTSGVRLGNQPNMVQGRAAWDSAARAVMMPQVVGGSHGY